MADGDYKPVKFSDVVNSCRTSHQVGTGIVNFINTLPLALLGWLGLLSNAVSLWGTLFLRGSIGIRFLTVSGLIGVLLHQMITIAFINSPAAFLLVIWTGLLLIVWLCHLVSRAERTIYNPSAPPIHSRCIGGPLRFTYRLWDPLMRSWSDTPLRVALIGEPLLFVGIAILFAVLEPVMGEVRGERALGIWRVPALTAAAIWIQALTLALSERRQLAILSDQEIEQVNLAEGMMNRPSAVREREPEGFAVIDENEAQVGGVQ